MCLCVYACVRAYVVETASIMLRNIRYLSCTLKKNKSMVAIIHTHED